MIKYCDNPLCHSGRIFDRVTHTMQKCLECEKLRAEDIREGDKNEGVSLAETLGFKRMFTGLKFIPMTVFGKTLYNELDRDMMLKLSDSIDALIGHLSSGKTPKSSIMYYLGSRSDLEMVAYLLLGSAYKAGLTFSPFLTPMSLRKERMNPEKYSDIVNSDVVVATFIPNIWEDIAIMESLLKDRAFAGKPTIFLIGSGVGLNGIITRMCTDEKMRYDLCLYAGIPPLSKSIDEATKVGKINSVIEYGNSKLGTVTRPLVVEKGAEGAEQMRLMLWE